MKIQIKDLKPNPFRDIENYPISESKLHSLINSINETGFWDNILARKKDGEIQIAYGHHRLLAAEKALGEEAFVNIPVKDLDDESMVRVMAEENNDYYSTDVAIIDETIRVTFEYLKKKTFLTKSSYAGKSEKDDQTVFYSFENLPRPKKLKKDPKGGWRYSIVSKQISSWLGKNWKEGKVYYSLKRLKMQGTIEYEKGKREEKLDKEAVQKLTQTAAERFTRAVEKHELPKDKQKKVVEKIVEAQRFGKQDIEWEVLTEKHGLDKKSPQKKSKEEVEIDNLVVDLEAIFRQSSALRNKLIRFLSDLRKYKIEQLSGLDVLIGEYDLAGLAKEMVRLAEYFHKNKREDTCQPQKLLNV